MSFTNYTTLKTAVTDALHRSDLGTVVADFITLAEDKLNKRLRIRAMENRQTASISGEYVELPDGFLAMRNLQINTSPRVRLEYASPEWLDKNYGDASSTGTPAFYTFVGGEIQLAPVPSGSFTLEMDFYKKWDIATDSTNWLLSNAPRCYYYGALLEAAPYLKDDKRIPIWSQLLENAISEVEGADNKDRLPSFGLQVRTDGVVV
jgi:hypothetical protein